MIRLPSDASEDEVLAAANEWVKFLARGDYEGAISMTLLDSETHWTPELLKTVITNYGSIEPRKDGKTFQVTLIETATVDRKPYQEVEWWEDADRFPCVGMLSFDLPLKGEWSDLTALFNLVEVDGSLVLKLDDVHVL